MVNGIALNGWSDGLSFGGSNVWQDVALEFVKDDLDVCYGEATATAPYHRMTLLL
jgi:hypothetical protein